MSALEIWMLICFALCGYFIGRIHESSRQSQYTIDLESGFRNVLDQLSHEREMRETAEIDAVTWREHAKRLEGEVRK